MTTSLIGPAPGKYESQLAWMNEGNCFKNPVLDLHYPEKGNTATNGKAQCFGCPVKQLCGEYAIMTGELYGVWGGMSERERRKIRKQVIEAGTT